MEFLLGWFSGTLVTAFSCLVIGLILMHSITDKKTATNEPAKCGQYTNENRELAQLEYVWPVVFTDPDFQYKPNEITRAVKDGLIGCGLLSLRLKEPEYFGHGLIKIGEITGTNGTHQGLLELVREWD